MTRRLTVVAMLATLAGPGVVFAAPAAAASTDKVWLTFDGGTLGRPITTVTNRGVLRSTTRQSVATLNGGSLTTTASVAGQGTSAGFPAFAAARSGARAIVRVTNTGSTDGMSPGTARFEFGADVRLDPVNASAASGSTDNGNNVIQRGLWNDSAQFKIQVDGRRPSCRVKGAAGAVQVTSRVSLTLGTQWYRLRCVRTVGSSKDTVTLRVTPISASGARGATVSDARSGPIGRAAYAIGIPLSVGGKLYSNGSVYPGASDQFNGRIDNAVLRIG